MTRRKPVSLLGVICLSLLLAACIPRLPDPPHDVDSGSVPLAERQTAEAFFDDTMPRYVSIIEEVAVEAGGTLGFYEEPGRSRCGVSSKGYEISRVRYYIPLIDYEDLRRIVGNAARRYGYVYSSDPEPRGVRNIRSVGLGDQDGNSLLFDHAEDDVIFVEFSTGCLPSVRPADVLERIQLPAPQELFPRLTVVEAYNANKQKNPAIFRQQATGDDGQSGS